MFKYYKAIMWGFTICLVVGLFTNLWSAICLTPVVACLWLVELIKGY